MRSSHATLPDMDGYELVGRSRKLPNFASVPIDAVTGRLAAQEETNARNAGCDACLLKPVSLEALAAALRREI